MAKKAQDTSYSPGWKNLQLSSLRKAVWNYKVEDDETMKKLIANIEKNEQIENIIVRPINDECSEYEVVNGNHRLDAMLSLGLETAFCYDIGIVSDAHAKRIAIETNETRFPINPARLSEIVAALADSSGVDDLLKTMPFSKDQIRGMELLSDVKGSPKEKKSSGEVVYYIICEKCGQKHYTDVMGKPIENSDDLSEPPEETGEGADSEDSAA